jgi:protein-S-isoprenylcysteine O-methyltransferase Ste14
MAAHNESPPPDHAGVLIPPPLIFLAPLVLAFVVDQRWKWAIASRAGMGLMAIGVIGIGLAVALGLSAVAIFRQHQTTILPAGRSSRAIVQRGPYRFTRNPMYVAMTTAYIGAALLMNSIWPLLVLPVAVLTIDRYVIPREERYLRRKFGDEYAAYARRVRRWL